MIRGYGYSVIGAGTENAMIALGKLFGISDDERIYIEADPCVFCKGDGEISMNPADYFRQVHGARVVIPLFVYEHSGITIRGGAPIISAPLTRGDVRSADRFVGDSAGWDTSFVGFLYDDPDQLVKLGCEDISDDDLVEALKGEISVYASYLEGDVSYFTVEDDETGYSDGCSGFIGGWGDHARKEMFSSLENAIEKRLAEMQERADMAARDIITI